MLNVYNIYDEVLEEFILQFLFVNDKACKRSMSSLYENGLIFRQIPDCEKYPNCFRVFKTATFDNKTGKYEPLEIKEELFDFSIFSKVDNQELE